ncbi:large-conductance mechanosensitive channel [Companilactobacillus crustorum]|uniref:Large-conductance mechanosensitive channel n=3 Tax=Companilactobacillus TaxID=2767879 RepID=A0A837RGJ0_9LACO|nr:large-conductance mechanosensitive channel protein MscL [Companilactobacillus crustorum]HCD07024.1 large-conductance mechanosensitive channel protein MscL [Lactobacillus sp.]APU71762.1 Large-conductance mechanosensitive channel [Companilactobacillus crustorum]KRK41166.1 large-conductance mechanosensitive channel [Companilactobacillus crustorum JCM 15951]KRO17773.1 large-conductance mechanosensitive channel [Companilactobacillus crustorum]WDT64764.1 large-conductance mechanosensitive channel
MIKEFKDFISRGNVMDLAVGVIMGAAFTAIVQSLVSNLINPLIGLFLGKIDLSNLVFKVGDATFKYGTFIESIINFLIIAFVVFLLVKVMNKIIKNREEETEEEETTKEDEMVMYLKKISDSLDEKDKNQL